MRGFVLLLAGLFSSASFASTYSTDVKYGYIDVDAKVKINQLKVLVYLDETDMLVAPLAEQGFLSNNSHVYVYRDQYSYPVTDSRSRATKQYMEYGHMVGQDKKMTLGVGDGVVHYKASANKASWFEQVLYVKAGVKLDNNNLLAMSYGYVDYSNNTNGNRLNLFWQQLTELEGEQHVKIESAVGVQKYSNSSTFVNYTIGSLKASYYFNAATDVAVKYEQKKYEDGDSVTVGGATLTHFLTDNVYVSYTYDSVNNKSNNEYPMHALFLGYRF